MAKYRHVDYVFDRHLWSLVISSLVGEYGVEDICELLDVSDSTLYNWGMNVHHDDYPHPRMSNWLKVCNLLDINPASFVTTED